jgi:hypothetical protein
MDRNLASILALAGTAAVSVTLAAMAPGDAYAADVSVDIPTPQKVSTWGLASSARLANTLLADGTEGSVPS